MLLRMLLLGGAVAAALLWPRLTGSPAWATAAHRPPSRLYVVRPGDTLWSIAARQDPQSDTARVVDEMVSQLHGAVIYPGEQVRVPAA